MKSLETLIILSVMVTAIMNTASSEPKADPTASGEAARKAADHILKCQLPDGLIAMSPDEKVWAVPYFANLTALGLLRAYQYTDERAYLDAALRYIDWYRAHINPDGTTYDYIGTRSKPEPTGDYDSSDAYPATYISLCWETFRITRDRNWLKTVYPSVLRSIEGVRLTWQADGLTFGKPNYKVKYLMDNLEVRVGLRAAVQIARQLRDSEKRKTWEGWLEENRQGLCLLWMEREGRFAMALFEDGNLHREFAKWYPDGMANAFALAYILEPRDPKAKALNEAVNRAFPDGADYWRFAALWKFGPRPAALAVREKMASARAHSMDYGLYLRTLTPEKEEFFFKTEKLRLPDLKPSVRR